MARANHKTIPLTPNALEVAKRVIKTEIDGLDALAQNLSPAFAKAIGLLYACEGRIIVSGIGKSGHIATKLAASLASTGAPAQFVHPAEAAHGDLGMITERDVILALSRSGETTELASLLNYAKRFGIPLIAMTAKQGSSLGQAADCLLLLPDAAEACPNGLAPTTSTTMQLALGDAIVVALLEAKGFSSKDFHNLHPGGRLGASLRPIRDLMHTGDALPLVAQSEKMAQALVVMSAKSLGCVGVIDDKGALCGIITDGDLRRSMSEKLVSQTAKEVMTKKPKTIAPDMITSEALNLITTAKIQGLFVVEDSKPIGFIHLHDLLRIGVV